MKHVLFKSRGRSEDDKARRGRRGGQVKCDGAGGGENVGQVKGDGDWGGESVDAGRIRPENRSGCRHHHHSFAAGGQVPWPAASLSTNFLVLAFVSRLGLMTARPVYTHFS